MPWSIALLLFLASNISLAFTLHLSKEIDTSRFFGARKMFCRREKYSTLEKSSSKTFNVEKSALKNSTLKIFNVEKIKRWKCIVGNFNVGKFIVENFQRRQQFNVEMHQGQTIFTVRNFISCRRVWKLLDTILGNTLRCEKVWEGCRHFVLIRRFGFLLCPIRQNRAIAATKKNTCEFFIYTPLTWTSATGVSSLGSVIGGLIWDRRIGNTAPRARSARRKFPSAHISKIWFHF